MMPFQKKSWFSKEEFRKRKLLSDILKKETVAYETSAYVLDALMPELANSYDECFTVLEATNELFEYLTRLHFSERHFRLGNSYFRFPRVSKNHEALVKGFYVSGHSVLKNGANLEMLLDALVASKKKHGHILVSQFLVETPNVEDHISYKLAHQIPLDANDQTILDKIHTMTYLGTSTKMVALSDVHHDTTSWTGMDGSVVDHLAYVHLYGQISK